MNIAPDQIDSDAAKVVQRLRRYDHKAYLVGGCVRDLLLGRKPKDFDVVTSATPQEIKRLFKNCRIIGRRFRLAHVFFGPKIIETSTFRANPREVEEDDSDTGAEAESGDLLIRRDNVFGTPEEDARRRDFTINGLFYDLESGQVIDHVSGLADLEARLVRTIGDPDIRLREDPVRILRAVKFAARCELDIEPETYRRMMEHRLEITKCAQARVSEEFYRLLRAGAAKRSIELLVSTELLDILSPELANGLKGESPSDEVTRRRARLWAYLEALDRQTARRPTPPSNAQILAVLALPPLRDILDPDSTGAGDVGQIVAQGILPMLERLKASRRDAELTRQSLLALRYVLPSRRPNRRSPRLAGRDFVDDALRLAELVTDAETLLPQLAGAPIGYLASPASESAFSAVTEAPQGIQQNPGNQINQGDPESQENDELPPELRSTLEQDRRRRGRDHARVRGQPSRDEHRNRPGPGQAKGSSNEERPVAAGSTAGPVPSSPARRSEAEESVSLSSLAASILPPLANERLPYLGLGAFGGRWAAVSD
jgi:poly(A) polymerase